MPTELELATKTTIAVEDDIDGGPAEDTVRFGLGAAEYEIDLNAANISRFREQLAPFIQRTRKGSRAPRARPARTASDCRSSAEVRAWAMEHGIEISQRGRIPASVTEQYEAATS